MQEVAMSAPISVPFCAINLLKPAQRRQLIAAPRKEIR
jgi:hypothetical protein